jgi:two-component system LytT family response regulator
MESKLRVIVADDERPARSFLTAMLRTLENVEVVGEAENGSKALELIAREHPDLALLDLQMPGLDGLAVVRSMPLQSRPLVAFVTAYDEYAVGAFEVDAVDYLLKPVDAERLRETLQRAEERLDRADPRETTDNDYSTTVQSSDLRYLERIPVKHKEEIVLLPVSQIASIVADGELLHLTNARKERYTICYRLKGLEARLDPARFVRLGRGTLVAVDSIARVTPLPGGAYLVTLTNTQQLRVSRAQSRLLRKRLLSL